MKEIDGSYQGKTILLVSHGTPCGILQGMVNGEELPEKNEGIDFPKGKIVEI
jgi:broad specificity phosphatase PhoE